MIAFHHKQDPDAHAFSPPLGCTSDGMGIVAYEEVAPPVLAATQSANAVIPLLEVGKRTGKSTDDPRAGIGIGHEGDPMFTLQAGAQHGVVAFAMRGRDEGAVPEVSGDVVNSLRGASGGSSRDHVLAFDTLNQDDTGDVAHSVRDAHGEGTPVVLAIDFAQVTHRANRSQPQPLAPSLNAGGQVHVFNETGHEKWSEEAIAGSLNAHEAREAHTLIASPVTSRVHASDRGDGGDNLIVTPDPRAVNISDGRVDFSETMATLGTRSGGSEVGAQTRGVVLHGIPRRLMPVECERLMGWPDDHTLVPDAKGKLLSDASRYKACGNGVASPVAHWIGERLRNALVGAA